MAEGPTSENHRMFISIENITSAIEGQLIPVDSAPKMAEWTSIAENTSVCSIIEHLGAQLNHSISTLKFRMGDW